MAVTIRTTDADIEKGGACLTASDGTKLAVILNSASTPLYMYSGIDGTPSLEDTAQTGTVIHNNTNPAYIDAAIDSNDNIHLVSAAVGNGGVRDIAYCIATYSGGSWTFGSWEAAFADYTEGAPNNPAVVISLDSNDKPHILFVDRVKMTGSVQDNVYYTEKTGASWATPTQIGTRATKTDVYIQPFITLRNSDNIEAFYYFITDGDPAYKTYTGTWSSESVYSESSARVFGVAATTGGTVYRLHGVSGGNLEESNVSTGYAPLNLTVFKAGIALDGTDRYILYIDSGSDVHYIYNTGSGWTDGGDLQTGTYNAVIVEWVYNNENQSGEISYIFEASGTVYYDSLSLGGYDDLVAEYGTFALTGQTTDLLQLAKLTAAQGSLTLTGQDTGFFRVKTMAADYGTFSLAGQVSDFLRNLIMAADQGTFTLSGQATDFLRYLTMVASQGTFTLTGQDTGFFRVKTITADYGTFSLTGQISDFLRNLIMAAGQGTFTLTGQSTGLLAQLLLTASQGTFTLTGQDANFFRASTLAANFGTFTLTGQDTNFIRYLIMAAANGVFTLSGQPIDLLRIVTMAANHGTFTLTGQPTGFFKAVTLTASQGTFTLTGQAVTLTKSGAKLTAEQGTFTLTGQTTDLLHIAELVASEGTFSLAGEVIDFQLLRQLLANQGTFSLVGQNSGLLAVHNLLSEYGTFTLTGQDADLTLVGLVTAIIALTLKNRRVGFTLEERDVDLTLEPRVFDFILQELAKRESQE